MATFRKMKSALVKRCWKVASALAHELWLVRVSPLMRWRTEGTEYGYSLGVDVAQLVAHPLLGDGQALAQVLIVDLEEIHSFEIRFDPSSRRNGITIRLTLLDSTGSVLADERFSGESVKDDGYVAARLAKPVRVPVDERVIVLVRSIDGTLGNYPAAWVSTNRPGKVFKLSGDNPRRVASALSKRALLVPRSYRGSLVIRLRGTLCDAPYYRLPNPPVDLVVRLTSGVQRAALVDLTDHCGTSLSRLGTILSADIQCYSSLAATRQALLEGKHDLLLLRAAPWSPAVRELLQIANDRYIPTASCLERSPLPSHSDPVGGSSRTGPDSAQVQGTVADVRQLLRAADVVLCATQEALDYASTEGARTLLLDSAKSECEAGQVRETFDRLLSDYLKRHLPKVSIVTILYNKASEILPVLDSYFRQTYEGQVEVVFVDDQSPDHATALVSDQWDKMQKNAVRPGKWEYKLIHNDRNCGNCLSRSLGIREATGDIVIIIDADCLLNADFVKRHVEAHAFDDCDVVIGPFNIETNGREPIQALQHYEARPWLALADMALQDPVNRLSFLNCVTRNFSIKAASISEDLFDPQFTYSADPDSGYGWEDVEMGYRLYQRGLRIKFIGDAFSIHISPEHEDRSAAKPLRSMRNFRRLYEKHPELGWVARRWASETFARICRWADETGAEVNEDRRVLTDYFQGVGAFPAVKLTKPRYKVLSYRWHVPHQYELYKLPILDVTLVTGLGSPMTESWDYSQRPMPPNARFVRKEDVNPREYDFAVLHFDENVLAPEHTNRVIGPEWGAAFKWMREHLDLPMVAICHGTPQFYGQYNMHYVEPNLLEVIESERARLVDYLGDMLVIVNSHQAQREWGFRRSRVIWHGLDPTEFPPATYERGILSPLGPLVMSRPHYRGYFLYQAVFSQFPEGLKPETLWVPDPHVLYAGNTYAVGKFRNYVDEIRRYSVYFNPTQRSPMPRARCEPMMCGVVTVSAKNHDVDMFIQNGVNGFYSDDPAELRDILIGLMRDPGLVRRIGAEGRKTAIDLFNHDRYLADWRRVIAEVAG
jgi:glycosyltransferase involved in cell wall biosynthesis